MRRLKKSERARVSRPALVSGTNHNQRKHFERRRAQQSIGAMTPRKGAPRAENRGSCSSSARAAMATAPSIGGAQSLSAPPNEERLAWR